MSTMKIITLQLTTDVQQFAHLNDYLNKIKITQIPRRFSQESSVNINRLKARHSSSREKRERDDHSVCISMKIHTK